MLWGIRPVQTQAAYGVAVERLRRQVHGGLLLPDEKLPAERQLAEDIGISRVTLREALRVLETERYLVVRRGAHGGAFVADVDTLQGIALRRGGRDRAAIMRLQEFRRANELAAAPLAALRRQMPELKRMRAARRELADAADAAALKRATGVFRLALGAAARNPWLEESIERGIGEHFVPFVLERFVEHRDASVGRHDELLHAIETKRGEEAIGALTAILDAESAELKRLSHVA